MKKILISLFIFSLFLSQIATAFTISDSGDYTIEGVFTKGGATSAGGTYKTTTIAAQPLIGFIESNNYRICLGAMCTYMFEPGYSVRLSGNLKYDDGNPVNTEDVWITVGYMTSTFIGGVAKTDANGNFNTRVTIPEYFYDKDFDLKIYASGKIEAVYECTYNQTSNVCS